MCAEQIVELTDSANKNNAAVAAPKACNPLIPAIIVIIALPVISFVLAEYVLFPRLQKKLEQIVNVANTTLSASEKSTQTENKQDVKQTYEIKDVTSNVVLLGNTRYIKVGFAMESNMENFTEFMKNNEARVIDTTIGILSALSVEEFKAPNIKDIVRKQLLQNIREVLNTDKIQELFFSQFIIK